jgi:hypothetical protein
VDRLLKVSPLRAPENALHTYHHNYGIHDQAYIYRQAPRRRWRAGSGAYFSRCERKVYLGFSARRPQAANKAIDLLFGLKHTNSHAVVCREAAMLVEADLYYWHWYPLGRTVGAVAGRLDDTLNSFELDKLTFHSLLNESKNTMRTQISRPRYSSQQTNKHTETESWLPLLSERLADSPLSCKSHCISSNLN